MRWRQTFMAEVSETLQRLGMEGCPVCSSAESLSMSQFPVLLVDGRTLPCGDVPLVGEQDTGDVIFAVRIECQTFGHLMLFNAQKYRTEDERILVRERAEGVRERTEGEGQLRE